MLLTLTFKNLTLYKLGINEKKNIIVKNIV